MPITQETYEKRNQTRIKNGTWYNRGRKPHKVQQIDENGNIVAEYESVSECAKQLFTVPSQVSIHANTSKMWHGYYWRTYKPEE